MSFFQTGVEIIVDGAQHTLKGTVTLVPGDNLASQCLGGCWHPLFVSAGSVWLLMKICKQRCVLYKCMCQIKCECTSMCWKRDVGEGGGRQIQIQGEHPPYYIQGRPISKGLEQ